MIGLGMMGGMILFWIVLIVLAVLLVRGLFQSNRGRGTRAPLTPRQILDERYARGEINREQYLTMLKDIQ
jgi:putative membrane protein